MTQDHTTTRGRRERPVPPGPLRDFAQGLRDLRGAAGNPSYRAMERKAGYSASALSAAAAGDRLPSLAVTQAYVGACGGDQDEWTRAWYAIRAGLDTTPAQPPLRPRRRLALLWLILVALALIGLVAAGTLPKIRMSALGSSQASAAPPDLAFTAVAGPSCPRDATRSVRIDGVPGKDGWKDAGSGGWTGAGCGAGFLFSELTSDRRTARQNTFQWRFTTGLRGQRQCFVAVYVPKSPLAGQRVWYTVKDGFGDDARTVAEFTLDQHMRQGTWAPAPVPVVIAGGQVMVEITDTGKGNTTGDQSMAAGPVRLSCV
ncbi:hypothetical protein ACIBQ1_23215 [Nonomuraea sp. NPDC050153]|uniref:hypothetical protein n=1 Tax=Nonomuraea sp. NPDC050153 TaxID=3364359 RepID=UPI0037B13C82